MEKQLLYTTFSPDIREMLSELRHIVSENKGSPNKLRKNLEAKFDKIDKIRFAIIEDMKVTDSILRNLRDALVSRYAASEVDQEYVMITECGTCAKSKKKRQKERSKRMQAVPVTEYIHESWRGSLLEEFKKRGFIANCPTCESPLEIKTALNMAYPSAEEIIYAITARVKSAGRYVHKLVDLIIYDKNDPRMRKRSITDRHAFKLVVNHPSTLAEKPFRRLFKRQFGIALPQNGNFEDIICYTLLDMLGKDFKPGPEKIQNNIKAPIPREAPNGRIEHYKMLQFDFMHLGIMLEGQIKTKGTFLSEHDRMSAISHMLYEQVEEGLREGMYMKMPEAQQVYYFLRKLYG
jgi:hypothetical protein